MEQRIAELLKDLERNPGASEEAIQRLREYAGVDLPEDYLDFLRSSNGGEGPFGKRGWLALYGAEEVPEASEDYRVSEFVPGLLLIGSSGGGTAYAIDTRSKDPKNMEFVQLPSIPLDLEEIEYRAPSFYELLYYLSNEWPV